MVKSQSIIVNRRKLPGDNGIKEWEKETFLHGKMGYSKILPLTPKS